MNKARIPIVEIFGPTLQGEGELTGVPTFFIRTGGCNYRCSWCDTMYAVDPVQVKANSTLMSQSEILLKISSLVQDTGVWADWITLSGGDPCLYKHLDWVIARLQEDGHKIAVETQGERWVDWLHDCDAITFSPKGPSSNMNTDIKTVMEHIARLRMAGGEQFITVKIVVFNDDDLTYAMNAYLEMSDEDGWFDCFTFQVGTPMELKGQPPALIQNMLLQEYRQMWERIMEKCKERGICLSNKVRVLPQTHVLLWPNIERGK